VDESDEAPEPIRNRFIGLAVASAVWMFLMLPCVSDASGGFGCCGSFVILTGLPMAVIWVSRTFGTPDLPLRARMKFAAWWVTPFVVLLIASQLVSDWGFIVRVALSSGELERAATEFGPDEFQSRPLTIGLFYVHRISSGNGSVAFFTSEGFLDAYGVLHMPPGSTAPPGIAVREHLYGPWYRFYRRF
jgi:hypothetical protein